MGVGWCCGINALSANSYGVFFNLFPKGGTLSPLNGESGCNKLKRGHIYFKSEMGWRNGGVEECVSYWY